MPLQSSKHFSSPCRASIIWLCVDWVWLQLQTIALASTQVFQPIWSRAAAQPSALLPHNSPDLTDDATLPSLTPSADAAAVVPAHTPQKEYLLRAASPLLEEMLESPVTASKPAPEAASDSPGRHALYQDAPRSSNSRHQQGPVPPPLLSPLPCAMSPTHGNNAVSTSGLPALGSPAGTDRPPQGVPQTVSKDAVSRGSMAGTATHATGVTAVIRADTCSDISQPGPDARLQECAAAVSSNSGSQGTAAERVGCNGAITGVAAPCCFETAASGASANLSLECLPGNAQAVNDAKMAAESSVGCLEADAKDTSEQKFAQQQPGKYLCSTVPPDVST